MASGRTVAVIGGGIAGLSAAWELSTLSPGTRVVVFESGPRLGGKLRTDSFGGREVDLGPDAFVARRPEAVDLCTELGLGDELVAPGVRGAYVWARGRLRPLPAGLALGVPTRLGPLIRSGICSPSGLVGPVLDLVGRGRPTAAGAPGSAPTDRSVGDIVRRRLGPEVTSRLAGPLIGGIHAGDVDDMSAAAVFPALLEADAGSGSLMRALRPTTAAGRPADTGAERPVFLAVRGGLGSLVDTMAGALEGRGVELRRQTAVRRLGRGGPDGRTWAIETDGPAFGADGVVVAVPGRAASELLRPHDPALADALGAVGYASVAIVTLRFADGAVDRPLDGTGFLVPRGEGGDHDPLVTACTWLTSKWPELARSGDLVVRASAGRAGDDRFASMADDALVAACVTELTPMMAIRRPPVEAVVTRWPGAFPQYAVGHLERVAAIEAAAARLPSTAVAGAALHGVGIPACIGSGRRAARAVVDVIGSRAHPAS